MKVCRKGSDRFVCCEGQYELMMFPGSQEGQKYPGCFKQCTADWSKGLAVPFCLSIDAASPQVLSEVLGCVRQQSLIRR